MIVNAFCLFHADDALTLSQLIDGLADEKVRWKEAVHHLEYMVTNVAGDVLLSAAYVAYLGPFTVSGLQLSL